MTMLRPAADGPAVIACNTCRHSGAAREDDSGVRGGARLAGLLSNLAAREPGYAGIAVEAMPCLFACQSFCAVHIRAPGKVAYVLGGFSADEEAARAILDYAVHYAASDEGRVAYANWPDGVKGHFLVRIPPAGFVAE
jgi:predicted metal-binding protein